MIVDGSHRKQQQQNAHRNKFYNLMIHWKTREKYYKQYESSYYVYHTIFRAFVFYFVINYIGIAAYRHAENASYAMNEPKRRTVQMSI